MEIIQGASITEEFKGMVTESYMATFSADEQQDNIINKENASLIFSPEFIPYYLEEQSAFNLSPLETVVYGFIRFFMKNNKNKRFYFTNEQLAKILNTNESSISRSIKRLKEAQLVTTSLRMRADGGTIRFVTSVSYYQNPYSTISNVQNRLPNKNNINKNILLHNIGDKSPDRVIPLKKDNGETINNLKGWLMANYPLPLDGVSDRRIMHNLIQVCTPRKGQDLWMLPEWKENFKIWYTAYKLSMEGKEEYMVRSVRALKDKIRDWRERGGK